MLKRGSGLVWRRFFPEGWRVAAIASRMPVTCRPTDTVHRALSLMVEGKRKLPVAVRGRCMGIVTATDILDYLGGGRKHRLFPATAPLDTPITEIMQPQAVSLDASQRLTEAIGVFRHEGYGSYPVVRSGRILGMASDWDIVKRIRGPTGVRVEDVMTHKPVHLRESTPVAEAATMMVRGGYRRLPVTKRGILTGVIVPSDLLSHLQRRSLLARLGEQQQPVLPAVTRDVASTSPAADVGEAITLMLRKRVGGLPVTDDGELAGIITESDVVQALL